MLTPADFTMTSSADPAASSRVVSLFSSVIASGFGKVRPMNGDGASGVAGDDS